MRYWTLMLMFFHLVLLETGCERTLLETASKPSDLPVASASPTASPTSATPTPNTLPDSQTSPSPIASATPSSGSAAPIEAPGGSFVGVGAYVANAPQGLNIRDSPNGKIIGKLKNGQRVSLTGSQVNGWYSLSSGGWIKKEYVEFH